MSGYDTTSGLTPATAAEILDDIETSELALIDAELDTSSDQPVGQLNGIVAAKLAELWELLQVAFSAFDESSAEGYLLENLAALTGTYREPAKPGTVYVRCTLTAGTTLPTTATVAKADEASNQWRLKEAYTAPSTGTHDLLFEATVTGPRAAPSGTLTTIVTPVSGWSAATNPADATQGRNLETDAELRLRRREELPAQGACNVSTCAAAVAKVAGVISVLPLENTGDTLDANGVPPHSFVIYVWDAVTEDADNTAVCQAIYDNQPAGIKSSGAIVHTFTDDWGNLHPVRFSRLSQVEITVVITLEVDEATYAGDAAVKTAILDYGATLKGGSDVIVRALMAYALRVTGVTDCPTCPISTGGTPTEANIPIGLTSIAVFDTSRITVITL